MPQTRVLILTDISTLTADHGEPDDAQSLVRYLLCSSHFDTEALIATCTGHDHACHPEYIRSVLNAYATCHARLLAWDEAYPAPETLQARVFSGFSGFGLEQALSAPLSPGAKAIAAAMQKPDPRPLWILVWGGSCDLAAALRFLSDTVPQTALPRLLSHVRVYAIADQYDDCGPWIREHFPDLVYILNRHAFRGMYRGGQADTVSAAWVESHLKACGSALAACYPVCHGGDPLGEVHGVKEGDTPSFLYLLPFAPGHPEKPEDAHWGGTFHAVSGCFYTDAEDPVQAMESVSRFRDAYQADFARRMRRTLQARTLSVTDFGAAGDGKTLDTAALQRAIDACGCMDTLVFPRGVYRSGALFLHGNMHLHLEEGAVLLGSDNTADYPVLPLQFEGKRKPCYASLLNLCAADTRAENLLIDGQGCIHAIGAALGIKELDESLGARGRALYLENTDGVTLRGITVRESPSWCIHLFHCTQVRIQHVTVRNKYREDGTVIGIPNNDGIDPECCTDVVISDCLIESEDDCIALKSGRDAAGRAFGVPCRHVRITDCQFFHGFGIACGSEMSGGISDVSVDSCTFQDSFSIVSLKNCRGRGSAIAHVTVRNCTLRNRDPEFTDCKWFRGAINIDQFYGVDEVDLDRAQPIDEGTPAIRHILLENLSVDTTAGCAVYVCGLPEQPVEDLVMKGITAKGTTALVMHNVRNLTLQALSLTSTGNKEA